MILLKILTAILLAVAVFLLGYWCGTGHNERKKYRLWKKEPEFLRTANALLDSIKTCEVFDREAWREAIDDLREAYEGKIAASVYEDKISEICKAFNHKSIHSTLGVYS